MVIPTSFIVRTTIVLLLISEGWCCAELRDDWEAVYQRKCNAAQRSTLNSLTSELTNEEVAYREYQYEVRHNVSHGSHHEHHGHEHHGHEDHGHEDHGHEDHEHEDHKRHTHEKRQVSDDCERKMKFILTTDEPAALSPDFGNRYDKMKKAMNSSKICVSETCYSSLSSLNEAMKTMQDRDERLSWWSAAREAAGQNMHEHIQMLTQFLNDMASENGFDNMAEQWESYYNDEMWNEAERLWAEIKHMHEVLHAWVRMKLNNGTKEATALPAHLLGDLWGDDWSSLLPYSLVLETISKDSLEMIRESLLSLDITSVPSTFISEADIRGGSSCKPLVNGLCSGDTIRLVVCKGTDWSHYEELNSQIGQYIWLKETQDVDFTYREIRKSESPDLYFALTEIFKLIMGPTKKWKEIGELQNQNALIADVGDMPDNIRILLQMALMTFGSLTYDLSVAAWRRNALMGKVDFNDEWWKSRLLYQGVEAPADVDTNKFFEVFHPHAFLIQDNFRHFFGEILTFQIFYSLCGNGYTDGELHMCDISKEEATKISVAMRDGSSKSFQEIVHSLTGTKYRDSAGILEYFKPLKQYLNHELKAAGEPIGWPVPKGGISATDILVIGCILFVLLLLISIWFFVGRRNSRVLQVSS